MQGIGKVLKDERERRGITLEEVAEATKIRTKYLDAIERDAFDVLPGEVYARGFVTAYLKYLGIKDAPEVVEIMKKKPASQPESPAQSAEQEPEQVGSRRERKKGSSGYEEKPLSKRSTLIILLSIGAVLLLLGLQWIYSSQQADLRDEPEQQPQEQVEEQTPETPVEPVEPVEPAEPEAPVYEGLEMHIEILDASSEEDRCWMRITVDGQATEVTLSEGQTQDVQAAESIELSLGNAGVVQVTVNGQDLGVMGGMGEVLKRSFLREEYSGVAE